MSGQKARDAVLALTIFGAVLLLPPILPFFDRPVRVLGVPLILVYVLGVWLALVAGAWALAHRLPPLPPPGRAGRDALRTPPPETPSAETPAPETPAAEAPAAEAPAGADSPGGAAGPPGAG